MPTNSDGRWTAARWMLLSTLLFLDLHALPFATAQQYAGTFSTSALMSWSSGYAKPYVVSSPQFLSVTFPAAYVGQPPLVFLGLTNIDEGIAGSTESISVAITSVTKTGFSVRLSIDSQTQIFGVTYEWLSMPVWSAVVNTMVLTPGGGTSVSINFPTSFSSVPNVVTSLVGFQTQTPIGNMPFDISVAASSVSTRGFSLDVLCPSGGSFTQAAIMWMAIPNNTAVYTGASSFLSLLGPNVAMGDVISTWPSGGVVKIAAIVKFMMRIDVSSSMRIDTLTTAFSNTSATLQATTHAGSSIYNLTMGWIALGTSWLPGHYCANNTDCSSSKCMNSTCCTNTAASDSRCTSCNATGGCGSCANGYALDVTQGTCFLLLTDGQSCALNATCASGLCLSGRCCVTGSNITSSHCKGCAAGTGYCTACQLPFSTYPANGLCYAANGTNCTYNSDCSSGQCLGKCCNSMVPNCTACNSTGACSACALNNQLTSNGQCKRNSGQLCSTDAVCYTNLCVGGRCCSPTSAAHCTVCDAFGGCSRCATNYVYTSNNQCLLGPGKGCSQSTDCASGSCLNSRCCSSATNPNCTSCAEFTGQCNTCAGSYTVSSSGSCLINNGNRCVYSSECVSTACLGGVCCKSAMPNCVACASSTGKCQKCAASYTVMTNGFGCIGIGGAPCSTSSDCATTCLGNYCCNSTYLTGCTTCGQTGLCTACSSGQIPSSDGLSCVWGSGHSCMVNTDCFSSSCLNGYCCSFLDGSCIACQPASGACSVCSGSKIVATTGYCLLQPGQSCDVNANCATFACLGAHCCTARGGAPYCNRCSSSGQCNGCTANYTLNATSQCVAVAGQPCSTNTGCSSTLCLGSRCCASASLSSCLSCNGIGGACSLCSVNFTLSPLNTCLLSPGQPCTLPTQCLDGTCLNGTCCGASSTANCTSCAKGTGACNNCASGHQLSSASASCLLVPGQYCDASPQCASGLCLGASCCTTVNTGCTSCEAATGLCNGCSAAYILVSHVCVVAGGGQACTNGNQCSSLLCLGGYCCGALDLNCASCAQTTGECTKCDDGFALKANKCYVLAGGSCANPSDCDSSTCLGGVCCNPVGVGANCASCSSTDGSCNGCAVNFTISATTGQCARVAGQPCSPTSASACASGSCLTLCCSATPDANCAVCDGNGACSQCSENYRLVTGGLCLLEEGLPCGANAACVSDDCRGGFCCATGVDSLCAACQFLDGACTSCVNNYALVMGQCLRGAGQPCADNGQCSSWTCRGGKCCGATPVDHCNSCGPNTGACIGCDAGYTSADNYASCRVAPGLSCASSNDCASQQCLGGVCCNTTNNPGCVSCAGGDGVCNLCSYPFAPSVLDMGLCKWAAGQPCLRNGTCSSLTCADGYCCAKHNPNCKRCLPGTGECHTVSPSVRTETTSRSVSFPNVTETYNATQSALDGGTVTHTHQSTDSAPVTPSKDTHSATHTNAGAVTTSATRSASRPTSTQTLDPPLLPPIATLPLPAGVKTTSTTIATVAMATSLGSPTTGSTAGRLSSLRELLQCTDASSASADNDPQAPFDWSTHPLGFALPGAGWAVQYDAGLVVGDLGIVVGVTLFHAAVTCLRAVLSTPHHANGPSTLGARLRDAAAWSRFPGLPVLLHSYVTALVSQSGASCFMRGTTEGSVLGAWSILVCCIFVVVVGVMTVRTLPRYLRTVPVDAAAEKQRRGLWALFHRFIDTDADWASAAKRTKKETTADDVDDEQQWNDENIIACFGAFFEDYTFKGRWWQTMELAISMASGVIAGIGQTMTCALAAWIGVVPPLVYMIALIAVRPHQRKFDFVAAFTNGMLLLLGGVAAGVAMSGGSLVDSASTAAAWCTVAASFFLVVPLIFLPYRIISQCRAIQRRRDGHRTSHTGLQVPAFDKELVEMSATVDNAMEMSIPERSVESVAAPPGLPRSLWEITLTAAEERERQRQLLLSADDVHIQDANTTKRNDKTASGMLYALGGLLDDEAKPLLTIAQPPPRPPPRRQASREATAAPVRHTTSDALLDDLLADDDDTFFEAEDRRPVHHHHHPAASFPDLL